jgi:hypothetical protein
MEMPRFKRAMRSMRKQLGESLMWLGCANSYYWVDPRLLSEEFMSSAETDDQTTPRSPADAMSKSSRWRKSA